jgi:hypothetical protein
VFLLTGVVAAFGLLALPAGLAIIALFRPETFESSDGSPESVRHFSIGAPADPGSLAVTLSRGHRGPAHTELKNLSKGEQDRGLRLAELLFIIVATGFGAVLWIAFVLAEIGVFSIALLGAAVALLVLAAIVRLIIRRKAPHWRVRAFDRWDLGAVLLLVSLSWIYFRPAEYILGGVDPGVYVLTGLGIARNGSIIQPDIETQRLSPEERAALFGQVPRPWIRSGMPGFTERDFNTGELEPQGYHLYPTWIAVVASLSGPRGALYGTPALALLAIAALYLLGRRLINPMVGLGAALLWGVDTAQIWFARTPSAEMLAEALLLTGAFLLAVALQTKSKLFAVLAGCSLGLVHLAKIDLFALPIAMFGALAVLWVRRAVPRELWIAVAAYGVVLVHTAIHAVLLAPAYTIGTIITLTSFLDFSLLDQANPDRPNTPALIGRLLATNAPKLALLAVIFTVLIGLIVLARRGRWHERAPRFETSRVNLAVVLFALSLGLYGYYVRPVIEDPLPDWQALSDVIVSDRTSLVRLGWYLSSFGLLLGLAGLTALVLLRPPLALALLVAGALLEGGLFLARGMITPIHFWAVRRFVPLVLPMLALGAAYALYLIGGNRGSRFRHVPGTILGVVLLGLTVLPFRPFLFHVEYGGAFDQLQALADHFPANAALIFEWSDLSGKLPAPLAILQDRIVFSIDERDISNPGLLHAVQRWTDEGRNVYYLRFGKGPLPQSGPLLLTPDSTFQIRLPQAEQTTGRLPAKVEPLAIDLDIYQMFGGAR